MKKNLIANFWMRILIRIINIIPSIIFVLFFSIFNNINFSNFKINQYYILLTFFSFITFFFNYILIIMTKGFSIGNFLTRTKIIFANQKKSKFIALFKKELFFSISISSISLFFIIFINKTLFIKIATKNIENLNLLENFYIAFISSSSSISILAQIIIGINLIIKKNQNWIDKWSETKIIYLNHFEEEKNDILNQNNKIYLEKIEDEPIEWV